MSWRCFFPFTLLQTPQNSSENLKYLFCFQSQGVKEHIGYLNVSICCLFAWAIWHIISYLAACGNEKGLLLYSVLGNCSKPFVCFWQQTLAVKDRLQLMTFPIHGNILLKSFKYCRNRWILLDTTDYCVRVKFFWTSKSWSHMLKLAWKFGIGAVFPWHPRPCSSHDRPILWV